MIYGRGGRAALGWEEGHRDHWVVGGVGPPSGPRRS